MGPPATDLPPEGRPADKASDVEDIYQTAGELAARGAFDEASARLLDWLRRHDRDAKAYDLLADVEKAAGRATRAILALERCVRLLPATPGPWAKLAALYRSAGRLDEAGRAYERALSVTPDRPDLWEQLAVTQLAAQRLDLAERAGEAMRQRFPENARTYAVCGHVEKAKGHVVAAVEAYTACLDREPGYASVIYNLSDLSPPATGAPLARRLERLCEDETLDKVDRANLHYARARIREAAGDHGEAFASFVTANEAAASYQSEQGQVYRPEALERRAQSMLDMYARAGEADSAAMPEGGLRPVFILGLPRSGTTLVERILAAHTEVSAGGELAYAQQAEAAFRQRREAAGRTGAVDPHDPADQALLGDVRIRYFDALMRHRLQGPVITDKAPGNFMIAGFLRLAFPEAVLIHVERERMANCWSLYTANFGDHLPYHHRFQSLAHFTRLERHMMQSWQAADSALVHLRYETLVSDPDTRVRALVKSAGLPWEEACLRFHETGDAVMTASHQQVRQPLHTRSVERWRAYEPFLEDLKARLREFPAPGDAASS